MSNDLKQQLADDFAVRIVNLFKHLKNKKKETVMSKQILRSGTSIGANIAEAHYAESDADFVHKLGIAQKEAAETSYWLRLLHNTEYITDEEHQSMKNDLYAIRNVLAKIISTMKDKNSESESIRQG